MKIISMYLPQFHRVKENDEWWGEGFTEWTAVKKAEKFFETHYQPHIPLGKKYYDLLDKNVMVWQTSLMKKYGVDAQCFYHYWFKDGRRILEKPAENLLRWKEIDMPFCFCWANTAWARSWSNISNKTPWTSKFEKAKDKDDSGILLEQKYGDEKQWREHLNYLLPFFKDQRYIKVENCPMFVIYEPTLIPCLNEMILKWNEWSKKEGFDKIYFIGVGSNVNAEMNLDGVLDLQPLRVFAREYSLASGRKSLLRLNYDNVWKDILSYQAIDGNVLYGGVVGYDDTPRRGKSGIVIEHATPEKFKEYLAELIAKNIASGNDLIFLNAWNEWGEGMHLEPDEKHGYGFLEAIGYAREHYQEYLSNYKENGADNQSWKKEVEFWAKKSIRYESYWKILDAWLCLKEENISIEKYFVENEITTIAIYGVGMLGKHLLKELEQGKIKVEYAVDRRADEVSADIKIFTPDDKMPKVDAIVVTVSYAFEDIKQRLLEQGHKNVISLEQIIMEMA